MKRKITRLGVLGLLLVPISLSVGCPGSTPAPETPAGDDLTAFLAANPEIDAEEFDDPTADEEE